MDTNQNNVQIYSEKEVTMKDLFLALWNQKVIIISITLICSILSGLFSIFMLSPIYQSKLNLIINIPDTYQTRFGEYILPITSNEQYINLILSNNVLLNTIEDMGYDTKRITNEKLKQRILIGDINPNALVEQSSFADNPQEALTLAQTLYDNYMEFLNVMTIESTVTFYYDKYSTDIQRLNIELESNKKKLMNNEELLSNTAQTINQKAAMQEIQDEINTNDFVILENVINPNYTALENDIIVNKQLIFENENNLKVYNNYMEELENEKVAIKKYYETGNAGKLESTVIGVIESSVYLPSQPVAPTNKISPNNLENVIIGAFLGGILSVFVALIKEYWFKKVN